MVSSSPSMNVTGFPENVPDAERVPKALDNHRQAVETDLVRASGNGSFLGVNLRLNHQGVSR